MTFALGGIAFWMPHYLEQLPRDRRPGRGQHDLRRPSWSCPAWSRRCSAAWPATGCGRASPARTSSSRRRPCSSPSPLFLAGALRAVPARLAADLPGLLLPVLQHRPDQHHPRQRDAPLAAAGRLRPEHPHHPRLRRRHLAAVIGFIADMFGTDRPNAKTGVLEHHANLDAGFIAVSVMILVGAILWLIGARYLGRDTERASTSSTTPRRPERACCSGMRRSGQLPRPCRLDAS